MTNEEANFIGSMNMCDEISNEVYKKIMCNCEVEEQQPCEEENPNCTECRHYDKEKHYCPRFCRVIENTMTEITSEQAKWIPVSERLPEEDGFYLATCDGEICGEDEPFSGLAEFENGKWTDDEEGYQCVLAWMPLPQPYREREDKK